MYVPRHFEEHRPERLQSVILQNPLGILVTHGNSGLDANHLPFEYEHRGGSLGVLHSHVARANPVWQDVSSGDEVLAVFRGPDAYISPNSYPSKHELHRQVPTWNYVVVHAHGHIAVRDDERYLRGVVGRLTKRMEASQPRPWRMGDSSPDFIDEMLRSIVGIEILVSRLVGKSKLSQNKETRDAEGAAQSLREQGHTDLADEMLARVAERPADDKH